MYGGFTARLWCGLLLCRPQRVLPPEARTLLYPEAVLLVDDRETEAMEDDRILDDSVCADDDVHGTVGESLKHTRPSFPLYDACQQLHPYVHAVKKACDCLKMLLGENLCRGHNGGLIAVADGYEHGEEGHKGLP